MNTPLSHQLTRRGFIAGSAGAAGMATLLSLAACAPAGGGSTAGPADLLGILPGDEPKGWAEVKEAINKKLEADLGITYTPEFIPWSNFSEQTLLKFTSGENFDTALEARWLHLDRLLADGALADLTELWDSGKFPELTASIDQRFVDYSKYKGQLYVVPQVTSFAGVAGFGLRQDLVEKYGLDKVTNFQELEKFLYDVKQNESGLIPFGLDSGYVNNTVTASPTALFNEYGWENPTAINQLGSHQFAYMKKPGTPVPFWEAPGFEDAVKKVRQYFQDGIINQDSLTAEQTTTWSQFTTGVYASTVAVNDGGTTARLGSVADNVAGASLVEVMPFKDGLDAVIATNFVVANYFVVNGASEHAEQAMALQNWLSIKENHDLVAYGIEGRDWNPVGDTEYERLSDYAFPTFALAWRVGLERNPVGMIESSREWLDWARDSAHFTADPLSGFSFDQQPVETEMAQLEAAYTQYMLPLAAGAIDTTQGLSDMKKAFEDAGLEKALGELETQAKAFLG